MVNTKLPVSIWDIYTLCSFCLKLQRKLNLENKFIPFTCDFNNGIVCQFESTLIGYSKREILPFIKASLKVKSTSNCTALQDFMHLLMTVKRCAIDHCQG